MAAETSAPVKAPTSAISRPVSETLLNEKVALQYATNWLQTNFYTLSGIAACPTSSSSPPLVSVSVSSSQLSSSVVELGQLSSVPASVLAAHTRNATSTSSRLLAILRRAHKYPTHDTYSTRTALSARSGRQWMDHTFADQENLRIELFKKLGRLRQHGILPTDGSFVNVQHIISLFSMLVTGPWYTSPPRVTWPTIQVFSHLHGAQCCYQRACHLSHELKFAPVAH